VIDAQSTSPQNDETGENRAKALKTGMSPEPNAVEQAVARALRDNLERLQRTSEELQQAVNDVVAACSSSRPTNALPPLLRAQSISAALTASLEVLTRFVALALQPAPRSPLEEKITQAIGMLAPDASAAPVRPDPSIPEPKAVSLGPASELYPSSYSAPIAPEPLPPMELPGPSPLQSEVADIPVAADGDFDINQLSTEEQELHRRANRVAKVSMQDIKMLRPEQVKLGRENKDICIRLKDDIEKAHREYDRRFKPIMDHPVDYFYRWMVEILADGDTSAIGEYPYATASKHR
jgi:hypothetical protein